MAFVSLIGSKAILAVCNFLLLACGFSLVTGGMLILFDTDRILLSKLLSSGGPLSAMPQPFLHYVAIGLASVGLLLASTGILGCWASCLHNYCLLTTYFMVIMVILVSECAVYAVAWAWPNCIGLGIDSQDLTKSLQRNYGTVGEEQFTAAFDLVQAMFNCCGVESANEYDTSLWRLQALGPSLAVPLTCCTLANHDMDKAYLNPIPVNSSLCQALEINRHEGFRHLQGCIEPLEQWYRQHYLYFLGIGLVAVLVEFAVLLSTILTCTRIYKYNREAKERKHFKRSDSNKTATSNSQNTYVKRSHQLPPMNAYSNETYAMTNSFRQNYKLVDRS